jgi:hypothetical protein
MRYVALLLLFTPVMAAQSSLMVGMMGRTTIPALSGAKEFDATYRTERYEGLATFQNQTNWTLAFRVYFNKHLFIQEAIRDNRITNAALVRQSLHPWVIQSGVGVSFRPVHRELLTFTASPSDRLKTIQSGFTSGVNSFFDCGHNVTFHAQYVRSRLLSESNQIGVGFEYVFHFKR